MAKPTEVPGLSGRTPLSVAAPLLVRARLADVRRYEAAFEGEAEPDGDAVHDMRVASRRLRAAIALFGERPLAALEPEVKALQDALGALRDLQVLRSWLRSRRGGSGRGAALAEAVDRDRASVEKKVRLALRAWSAALAAQIDGAASEVAGRGRLGGRMIRERVETHLARLDRRLERAGRKPSPRRVHRVRIATKKLRYVAELVRPAFQEAAGEVLTALVPLQEQLGDLHDTHVRVERLKGLVEAGTAAEAHAAEELLVRVEEDRAQLESAVKRELSRWNEEDVVRELREGFR
jgi:CHAD domain-containing protein